MPFVERPNAPSLHYVVDDYTDPWKNAPYLVLQHGNGRSSRFWYSWVPYLSRFYKIVRPDVRGLGLSAADFDLERDFTLETCAADLLAIIDDIGAESMHICGESMGGMIGMAVAALHPSRVRTLTLLSTPIRINERGKVIFLKPVRRRTRASMHGWSKAIATCVSRPKPIRAWSPGTTRNSSATGAKFRLRWAARESRRRLFISCKSESSGARSVPYGRPANDARPGTDADR